MSRKMKDSGVEWIGEIPEDWKLIRLCNMTKSIFLGKTPVYSEKENENYIVGQKNNQANGVDFSDIKYGEDEFYSQREEKEFLRYGDVLLNTLGGGSVGRIGYWNIKNNKKYITDGHLMVIRAKENCDSKFLYYAMVSQQKKLEDDAVGSTNQAFLTVTQVYKNVIASTDYEMQNKIARFLDEKCAHIDSVLEKMKVSIEEYKNLKQSIITCSVTKGNISERLMRECDIAWLGKIPEDWKVYRIANLYQERSESGLEELPILTVSINSGVSDREVADEEKDRVFVRSEDRTKYKRVYPGDLVYNMMRAWQGAFGAVRVEGMVSPAYVVAKPKDSIEVDSRYMEALLRTPEATEEMHRYSREIVDFRLRLYWPEFKNIRICLPPIEEQKEIADFINRKSQEIDFLINKKEQFISELENYKKSLIYEYVTGKKEVPEF